VSVKVVRAQDMQANLARPVPGMVHAVAQWALPKIAENYAAQEALIERKVGEAKNEAERGKAAARERGRIYGLWAIFAGVLLAVAVALLGLLVLREEVQLGLLGPAGEAGLVWGGCGGIVLAGVALITLRIGRQLRP